MAIDVRYPSADGGITAALAKPDGLPKAPAVILLTDIWGLRDVYRHMADRIASDGFVVMVPDLYHRLGGKGPKGREDFATPGVRERAMGWKDGLTRARIASDMKAAIAFLDAQPFVRGPKIGVVGYCMSGGFAMWTAADFRDRIGAAASFHGGDLATDQPDSPHRLVGAIAAEMYFGHADDDPSATPEMIATLDKALAQARARHTSVLYKGGRHGFAVSDGPAYNREAAEKHFAVIRETMRRNL